MTTRIATVSGTMLTPGVSRNRRLYSKELIAKAAARMSERIADPHGLPIVMRTHHDAGDDSRLIVGRLTGVKVSEDGSASYAADLYDTAPGRDIAALVTGKEPALRSVSIHGYWLGPVRRVDHAGESVTTADDLEIDAVDFTATPGVLGATVAAASWVPDEFPAAESGGGRTPISESVEATVEAITEQTPADEAYSAKQKRAMADKGQAMKNADGDPSYPIKTKADLRKAIRAVGRGNANHDKIRAHIIARAKALGLTSMLPPNWNQDGSMKESGTRYSDVREYYDGPGGPAGFCIDAYNGPTSITIRNCSIDPAELRVIAAAAMDAVANALQQLDPDMDADIDVAGAPNADTDSDMDSAGTESATVAAHTTAEAAIGEPATEAVTRKPPPEPGEAIPEEEAAMGEPATETQQTAAVPARSLTDADIAALGAIFTGALQEHLAPVLAAVGEQTSEPPKATAAESAEAKPGKEKSAKKALKETAAELQAAFDAKLAEALAQQRDELREMLLKEHGFPPRQGYRVHENDQTGPDGTSPEDLYANRAELLLGDFGRTPQPAP